MNIREFVQNPPADPFYAVIGSPVKQSKSPLIHNLALEKCSLPGRYFALDTPSDSFAWVGKLLDLPGFRGLNVTIPHKSRIMDVLHMIDPLAQAVGAVNTVKRERIGFAGYNTDVAGVEASLKAHRLLLAGQTAVILGSGGAARAVVAALRAFGVSKAYIVSRKGTSLSWPVSINSVPVEVTGYNNIENHLGNARLIVNTTPVGMFPDAEKSPIRSVCYNYLKDKICMDAIYNPLKTLFLKEADVAGARATINGIRMFTGQASAAFTIWTGKVFPLLEAEEKLLSELQSDDSI
jgi:shikimate dehydrogenase